MEGEEGDDWEKKIVEDVIELREASLWNVSNVSRRGEKLFWRWKNKYFVKVQVFPFHHLQLTLHFQSSPTFLLFSLSVCVCVHVHVQAGKRKKNGTSVSLILVIICWQRTIFSSSSSERGAKFLHVSPTFFWLDHWMITTATRSVRVHGPKIGSPQNVAVHVTHTWKRSMVQWK